MISSEQHLVAQLERLKALVNGHFVYATGLHGPQYLDKTVIYAHPPTTALFSSALAERFRGVEIDTVIAPATMGVALASWVAHYLCNHRTALVYAAFADKTEDSNFVIKRGFGPRISRKRIAIVEDILHTGDTVRKVVAAVREAGGEVVIVGAFCNRGRSTTATLDVPRLECLLHYELEAHSPDNCPLCRAGIPVNSDLGHG